MGYEERCVDAGFDISTSLYTSLPPVFWVALLYHYLHRWAWSSATSDDELADTLP